MNEIEGFLIGVVIGILIMGTLGFFIFGNSNGVVVNDVHILNNLDQHQINEITAYLKTNYPENIIQTPNERTTIIYVYQNGTQPTGACKT